MTRSRALILAAGLLIAAAFTGVLVYAAASDPATGAGATPPRDAAAIDIECANITRAHTAWDSPTRARSSPDFTSLDQFTIRMELDAATAYRDAATGYASQASKTLVVALANLAYELSVANASLTAGVPIDSTQAVTLQSAVAAVGRDYDAWRRATCS